MKGLRSRDPQMAPQRSRFNNVHYYAVLAMLTVFLISRAVESFRSHWYGGVPAQERRRIMARCEGLNVLPGRAFGVRAESDRFVPGTKATLLRNGKVSWHPRMIHDPCCCIHARPLLDLDERA
jgi:hypothetical protein